MTQRKIYEVGNLKLIFLQRVKRKIERGYDICLQTNNVSDVGTTHQEGLNGALKTAIMIERYEVMRESVWLLSPKIIIIEKLNTHIAN